MKKIISFWEKVQKSKRPSSKSYLTVKGSVEDPPVTAKLQFFSFVSSIVEPYLRKYETDKPMIPFVYLDLKDLVIKLLDNIVKPTVINNCKSGKQLKEIDLSNEENLISVGKINMGFDVEDIISRLKQQDKVSLSQLKAFKEGEQQFVISMLEKLFEKSALASVLSFVPQACSILPSCANYRKKSYKNAGNIFWKHSSRYHSTQSMR